MELVHSCPDTGYDVLLIRGLDAEREQAEGELVAAGVPLPLPHRLVWAKSLRGAEAWFLLVRDEEGRSCGGVAIEVNRSRALPGHLILRASKLGPSLTDAMRNVALVALAKVAKGSSRVLRLHVHVFSLDRREVMGASLSGLGFAEVDPPSSYRHTLAMDLRRTEEEIFDALHKTARKNIRDTMKAPVTIQTITDAVYANRIDELQREALRRTGADCSKQDWTGRIELSREFPGLSRIVGLFAGDDTQPSSMAAFGWACNHGDHAEYREAGSIRRADIKVSLSYLPLWDLIGWAKAGGAGWFDLGGVTVGHVADAPLEGISDFKRYFCRNVVEVGAEWVLEPHPLRARVASFVAGGADRLRGWMEDPIGKGGNRGVGLALSKECD